MTAARSLVTSLLRRVEEEEVLLDLIVPRPDIGDAIVGFHCQQVAEKLLKVLLTLQQVAYRRTHDLGVLIALLERAGAPVPGEFQALTTLTLFAVETRYED